MNSLPWPAEGEVHIRSFPVSTAEPPIERFERLLAPAERERSLRLLDPRARKLFVIGRGFLRQVLGGYLGVEPERLVLEQNDHGKPHLVRKSASATTLSFNLSHSGQLILLAVTAGRNLGIDLERMVADLPLREMARLAFSPREQDELFSLPPRLQQDAFYRCWTRKEAFLKGCGRGFSLASSGFNVSLLPGQPPALTDQVAPSGSRSAWQLFDIPVPPGYVAALAIEGNGPVRLTFPENSPDLSPALPIPNPL